MLLPNESEGGFRCISLLWNRGDGVTSSYTNRLPSRGRILNDYDKPREAASRIVLLHGGDICMFSSNLKIILIRS